MSDGSCVQAAYALCTFSLGVLQNDVVAFEPELPEWKQTSIATFQMGTYTKIFLQFNETFWDPETQFFLYADPTRRGYYPVFQSLTPEGFLPGSNILFVTVVGRESYRVEAQDDETTKQEVLEVLRQMFPDVHVPEPTAFMYPRWSLEPWVYGSYSNWPVGTTLEMHQNLRANVGRLYFAGEVCYSPTHCLIFPIDLTSISLTGLCRSTRLQNTMGSCMLRGLRDRRRG
jgi:polyamine oxidase